MLSNISVFVSFPWVLIAASTIFEPFRDGPVPMARSDGTVFSPIGPHPTGAVAVSISGETWPCGRPCVPCRGMVVVQRHIIEPVSAAAGRRCHVFRKTSRFVNRTERQGFDC